MNIKLFSLGGYLEAMDLPHWQSTNNNNNYNYNNDGDDDDDDNNNVRYIVVLQNCFGFCGLPFRNGLRFASLWAS